MYHYLDKIKSPKDLKSLTGKERIALAVEIRDYMIQVVSKNGGHLSSNLGVVELTMAMHLVFDSPKDQFVFDVSHQSYVHKLLTGRYEAFSTLRQFGGMSGFTKRNESEHDIFEAGHASTSLSAAMGLAKARDIKGEQHEVIAVIGDGAMTGGMAFEALNHMGHDGTKLIVILNDNEMSISQNVGGLSQYLSKMRTSPNYYKIKHEIQQAIEKIPAFGNSMKRSVSKVKASVKQMVVPGMLFEELGLTYIGVVDGHNLNQLTDMLLHAKNVDGPVLIHVRTKKGRGYAPAEIQPDLFHGIGPFELQTGKVIGLSNEKAFSKVFGESLVQLAKEQGTIVAVTAAMPSGTGLDGFMSAYPERFFDVGIAEEHAVTFAAGLARNGLKPFFAVYSTFLQRGFDQILHDVCIQNLPVTFCLDRAGLVGSDGETHHGVFDLSYLLTLPNITVLAPKDGTDLRHMIAYAAKAKEPVAIRYPRGTAYSDQSDFAANMNQEVYRLGDDFTLVAVGRMHHIAMEALELLAKRGIKGQIVTPKQLKPFDLVALKGVHNQQKPLFTLEENQRIGGFGAYLHQLSSQAGWPIQMHSFGIPDQFVTHGEIHELLQLLSLDPDSLAEQIAERFARGGSL